MTRALDLILKSAPEPLDVDTLWSEAFRGASEFRPERGKWKDGSPSERVRRLRESLDQELVAFHDRLIVSPYSGERVPTKRGVRLWDIGIPLTLFPKRDQGFTRVECLVEFCSDGNGFFRVVDVFPEKRKAVLARAEMGGRLEFKTRLKMGIRAPFPTGTSVSEAGGRIYAQAEAGPFIYEASRMCTETEIVKGCAARWRLDDSHSPERVGIESHQLRVILEVEKEAPPVHAAGYVQAYSNVKWLTKALGGFWRDFRHALRKFFERGLPAEAYTEWENIVPN